VFDAVILWLMLAAAADLKRYAAREVYPYLRTR
jgi:hypothetical protein